MAEIQVALIVLVFFYLYAVPGLLITHYAKWEDAYEKQDVAYRAGDTIYMSPAMHAKYLKHFPGVAGAPFNFIYLNIAVSPYIDKQDIKIGQQKVTCFGHVVDFKERAE